MRGSGRGNKGQAVIDDERPSCPVCDGFMKSNGKQWTCTDPTCRKAVLKVKVTDLYDEYRIKWGFETGPAEAHARACEKKKRLIVTSAQNNTDVDLPFWQSLKQCAKHYKCEIAVMPSHYQNKTTWQPGDDKYWVREVAPYLVKSDIEFDNVLIKSDVRIQPSTLWPLDGKQSHGGEHDIIFGHPQLARQPVPTGGNTLPKRLFTCGSVTLPNYSVTDAGEKAKFHHVSGALILEKVDGHVFVRQLNADSKGHFYDLDKKFTPRNVTTGHRALSLTTGDEHVKFNVVERETYTKRNSIVKTLKPHYLIRHDILDCYALSHHHTKDPMTSFIKHHSGDNDIVSELDEVVEFINRTTPDYSTTLIVPSNHHDHLLKALNRISPNDDHQNAVFIAEMQALMRKAALDGNNYDPFYLYLKDRLRCKAEFLDRNEPYMVGDVDMSQHGDVGTNGSRGSARGIARTTHKANIGHSHGARIVQGVYQTGVSTSRLEYERGLSDHSNTHILQYPNGKRTLIDIVDGRWRG